MLIVKKFFLLCFVSASLSCAGHSLRAGSDDDLESGIPLTARSSASENSDEAGSSSRAPSHSFWFPATKTKQLACLGFASAVGLIVGAPVGSAVTYIAMSGSLASLATLFASNITTFAPLASNITTFAPLASNITTFAPLASTTPSSTLDPMAEARESQRLVTCHLTYGQLPKALTFEGAVYQPHQTTPECDEKVNTDMLVPHPGTTRVRDTSDMWGQRMLAFFKTEVARNPSLDRLVREEGFVGNMHWVLCAFSFEEKEEIKKHFPLVARAIDQGFSCPDRGCISQG